VGVAALGALVPTGGAIGASPQEYVDGMHSALAVGAGVAFVAAIGAAALLRSRRAHVAVEPEPAHVAVEPEPAPLAVEPEPAPLPA
jgi:hypothetical protein